MTNLPQDWEVKKLGDIAEISSGGTPSRNKKEYWENGIIPWVKIKDIKENFISTTEEFITEDGLKNSSAKLFKKGTLLYSIFATLGEVAILDIDATTNQAIAGINIKENNANSLYLMYFLKSIKDEICNKGRGVAQNNLNLSILKQIQIPLPPLKEQERIVGILDKSFANIDKSIKILEQDLLNLDELMQSALQKAFNPLKDNAKENYQLPQGWEWKSLGDIAVTSSGGTPLRNKKEYWENGTIKWLKSGELNDGYIDFTEENITQEAIKHSSAKIFSKGTLLIAMYGATAGKLGILDLDSATNQAICAFLHKDNENIKFFEKFLFHFLFFIRDKIIKDSFGGAQPNISQTYIKNLQIPIPPLQEQEQIASYLDELSLNIKDLKQNYQAQIKNLQELKKSLLDKAFKGRL
ncbi:restriction endonuclease subunit S [Campylobacter volucris]|uniref:Restriction endonuclease subunit S n=1 Tax=Campylobacter volucris TaxID=1031542 RepID=A0AAF1D1V8_9BACT|nr:restriction endonuclease subunit S [Campylobacter volucris]KAB0579159.1 restriction endonuclease subunit S [Campylobacter volucris]QBL14255.1 restriction endonuclease subunit S [Campylobacter volucris]TXK68908.1 restriction endonuclease subunit S [Campylobacter volucris]